MKVAILYSHFPHYRKAVFESLLSNNEIEFKLYVGGVGELNGIKCAENNRVSVLHTKKIRNFYFQTGFLRILRKENFDAIIFLGDWKIISYWFYALAAKFSSVKVLFWTHGWLRRRGFIHRFITNTFYSLADGLLVYGNRARHIGITQGFDGDRISVIYNSLDIENQISQIPTLVDNDKSDRYFLSLGRLTPALDLSLMLKAMKLSKDEHGTTLHLKVVGEGPCFDELKAYAVVHDLKVEFLGAIYDENKLARLISGAVAVVSPGKAGLVVMHSLVYGTPVITHNNFEQQMPEAEAIVGRFSRGFFKQGDILALLGVLQYWWISNGNVDLCSEGLEIVMGQYTPTSQVRLISKAIWEACER